MRTILGPGLGADMAATEGALPSLSGHTPTLVVSPPAAEGDDFGTLVEALCRLVDHMDRQAQHLAVLRARADAIDAAVQAQAGGVEAVRSTLSTMATDTARDRSQTEATLEAIMERMDGLEVRAAAAEARGEETMELLRSMARMLRGAPGLRGIPVDRGEALVRLSSGQHLYVDPRHPDGVAALAGGTGEQACRQLLRGLVQRGQVCIDIGAGSGMASLVLATLTGPRGRVIAFEPHPERFSLLTRSFRINGYEAAGVSEAWNAALGAEAGIARLDLDAERMPGTAEPEGGPAVVEAPRRTLDSLGLAADGPVFIRIAPRTDLLDILHGARGLIAASEDATILIDFDPTALMDAEALEGVVAFLAEQGLRAFRPGGGKESIRPIREDRLALQPAGHIVLSRRRLDSRGDPGAGHGDEEGAPRKKSVVVGEAIAASGRGRGPRQSRRS